MNNNKYVISLTTIPRRLEHCTIQTILAIKKQTTRKIILNIPYEYLKWGKYEIDENLFKNDDQIIIYRPTKDYGPATKLLGAIEYIQNKSNCEYEYVITIDDDILFKNDNVIDTLINKSNEIQDKAITFSGIKLLHFPYCSGNGLSYKNVGQVDIPAGYRGVLYPIKNMINNNNIPFNFMKTLPKSIFNNDDAYFGILLSVLNIELIAIKRICDVKLTSGAGDSGVCESIDEHRSVIEREIFQYAIEQKLLPLDAKYKN